MDQILSVVPLHHHPDLLYPCCDLLSQEWPRSRTARVRSLEVSNDNFPTSLVLLLFKNGSKILLGHCKVSVIPREPRSCFFESVVVDKNYRGQGLGRILMTGTEDYVKRRGFTTVYLTTFDKQGFYRKLGYEFCEPVCVFGGGPQLANRFQGNYSNHLLPKPHASINPSSPRQLSFAQPQCTVHSRQRTAPSLLPPLPPPFFPPPPPPPPPPPSPPPGVFSFASGKMEPGKDYLKKVLL